MTRFFLPVLFFFAYVESAHAGFVAAAIGAFASTALGGLIVNTVIGLAIKVVTGLIGNMLAKKNKAAQPGTTLSMSVGGDVSLPFPLGKSGFGGVRTYIGSWDDGGDTDYEFITDVRLLSIVPISTAGFALWINDQRVTIMTGEPKQLQGYPILEYRKEGKDYAWVELFDGNQTTTNAYLSAKFGAATEYPFSPDMIGRGVAYAVFTAKLERELWATGYPDLLFEVPSIPLYDIRKDSTAGGSGSHRWGNRATYEPSQNRAVQMYNVARGIYYGNQWIYGGQNLPAFHFPASSWMAAMNECDRTMPLIGGGTESQFHGGGIVECNIEPADTIDELLRSSSGLITEVGGVFKLRIGAPGAPVFAFTDNDIIVTREQGYSPFPPLSETYNIINLTYSEPTQRWGVKESPQRRDATMIAQDDNRELPISIDLPWVQSNTTTQRIGATALKNGRRWRTHSHFLGPEAALLEPLDVVSWSSSHNGYITKEFDIEEIGSEANFLQFVRLRENNPADYDWNPNTDQLPYSVTELVTVRPTPQPLVGWQAFPAILYDNDAIARRPTIEVHYAGGLGDVRAVRIQVRLAGETAISFDGEIPYDKENLTPANKLAGQFLPNTNYEVRGIFLPFSGRRTLWSNQDSTPPYANGPWIAVLTPDVKMIPGLDFDPYSGVVGFPQLGDDLKEYQEFVGDNLRQIINQAQAQATITGDQELANYANAQRMRRELGVTFQKAEASWSEDILVAVGPGSAIVTQLTELEARVDTEIAAAITLLQTDISTVNGKTIANANAITSISAGSVNGDTSTANFRMSVQSGPTGYSRIAAEARQSGGGNWRTAAWFLDVPNNVNLPTRFVVDANQFIVIADGNTQQPFIVDAGGMRVSNAFISDLTASNIRTGSITANRLIVSTLSSISANIGHVTTGLIDSPVGKMVINLTDGYILMAD